MTHEQFLQQKDKIQAAFESAILDTLIEMGDNIQGISWFCSRADEYNEQIANARRIS